MKNLARLIVPLLNSHAILALFSSSPTQKHPGQGDWVS